MKRAIHYRIITMLVVFISARSRNPLGFPQNKTASSVLHRYTEILLQFHTRTPVLCLFS